MYMEMSSGSIMKKYFIKNSRIQKQKKQQFTTKAKVAAAAAMARTKVITAIVRNL